MEQMTHEQQIEEIKRRIRSTLATANGKLVTGLGQQALLHMADGMMDSLSVLTGEPVAVMRLRFFQEASLGTADTGRPVVRLFDRK